MILDDKKLITFYEREMRFDYFFNKNGNDNLIVLMPSALNNRDTLPKFSRWSWVDDIKGFDSICVSDPTIYLNNEMLGGWLQGKDDSWALERIVFHIFLMATYTGYKNIIFYGSSLGGFSSIQSTILIKKLGLDTYFVAENPQVNLRIYQWKRHRDLVANVSYNKDVIEEVECKFDDRLNIIDTLEQHWNHNDSPTGIIISKESDTHHHHEHVLPLISYLKSKFKVCNTELCVIPKEDDNSGHTALNKSEFLSAVNEIYKKLKK